MLWVGEKQRGRDVGRREKPPIAKTGARALEWKSTSRGEEDGEQGEGVEHMSKAVGRN